MGNIVGGRWRFDGPGMFRGNVQSALSLWSADADTTSRRLWGRPTGTDCPKGCWNRLDAH